MLFTPARPFRTFQNKAWVSSNCAQCPAAPREPGSCLHLCQRHPPTAVTSSCNSTWAWDLFRRSLRGYFYSKVKSSGRSVCQERVLLERIVKTEDVFKETAAVHVVVLCLLRGLALLPPPKPQQLLLSWSSREPREEYGVSRAAALPACHSTAAHHPLINSLLNQ